MFKYLVFPLFLCFALFADDWKRVYLATYPRSGNHWLRYIVEEVTGVATGSVYQDPDPPHLPHIFPWGGYSAPHGYEGSRRYPEKSDIVMIKTHYPALALRAFDGAPHEKIIRIIRHPVDSIYSYYVWLQKGRNVDQVPNAFVKSSVASWKTFQRHYNRQPNVFTYSYEEILKDPHTQFKNILKQIGYEASDEEIWRALEKYPPFGTPLKHLSKFSPESLDLIYTELEPLLKRFGYL